ncbi:DUF4214 domain-containing protein [Methylorubrum populi]|uniref:DUF4214 domain-containing protein n=1 Tax=Methylorubrum populi TaxID=223967 RepID=UPI003F6588AA
MKSPVKVPLHLEANRYHLNVGVVAWASLKEVDQCLKWIGEDFLGPIGGKWANALAARHAINDSYELMQILDRVFPSFLQINNIIPFSSSRALIYEGFFEEIMDEKFLDYAYKLFVRRNPDGPGYDYYSHKLKKGRARKDVLVDFSKSLEASYYADRKFVTKQEFTKMRRHIRLQSESLMFRRPKFVPDEFFFNKPLSIAPNETSSEWHFIYKAASDPRMVLSPGINLGGRYETSGRFKCAADWVLFGPKIFMRAGHYELFLDLEADSDFTFSLDASADGALMRIFELELIGSTKMKLRFTLDKDVPDFETRILNLMSREKYISINQLSVKKI